MRALNGTYVPSDLRGMTPGVSDCMSLTGCVVTFEMADGRIEKQLVLVLLGLPRDTARCFDCTRHGSPQRLRHSLAERE
jgi:hypothetical protein